MLYNARSEGNATICVRQQALLLGLLDLLLGKPFVIRMDSIDVKMAIGGLCV